MYPATTSRPGPPPRRGWRPRAGVPSRSNRREVSPEAGLICRECRQDRSKTACMVVSVILRRVLGSSWLPMIAALLGILLILADRSVSAGDLAKFVAFLALTVALPGVFTWRLLLAHLHADEADSPTWLEDLSLGTIFGFGVQLPVYLLGV